MMTSVHSATLAYLLGVKQEELVKRHPQHDFV